jgi:hypothetical protein
VESPDRPSLIDELKDVVHLAFHEGFARRQY